MEIEAVQIAPSAIVHTLYYIILYYIILYAGGGRRSPFNRGLVDQTGRSLPSQGKGRGFKSRRVHSSLLFSPASSSFSMNNSFKGSRQPGRFQSERLSRLKHYCRLFLPIIRVKEILVHSNSPKQVRTVACFLHLFDLPPRRRRLAERLAQHRVPGAAGARVRGAGLCPPRAAERHRRPPPSS